MAAGVAGTKIADGRGKGPTQNIAAPGAPNVAESLKHKKRERNGTPSHDLEVTSVARLPWNPGPRGREIVRECLAQVGEEA